MSLKNIRIAVPSDGPALLRIMEAAVKNLQQRDWFLDDDLDFIMRHIDGPDGYTLKYVVDGVIGHHHRAENIGVALVAIDAGGDVMSLAALAHLPLVFVQLAEDGTQDVIAVGHVFAERNVNGRIEVDVVTHGIASFPSRHRLNECLALIDSPAIVECYVVL